MALSSPGLCEVLTPSLDTGATVWGSRGLHRISTFWRLQDKQPRYGLLEIGPSHKLYPLTTMIQAGLWAATQASVEQLPALSDVCLEAISPEASLILEPFLGTSSGFTWPTGGSGCPCQAAAQSQGLPTEKDFSEVVTQAHEGFQLDTLAGPAFAWLRHFLDLSEEDYRAALGPGGPYLQFFSTSHSKAIFFLSHDQRFFLKTQQRREVRVLLTHLPRYMQHLQRYPYSLLARLLGVHCLRVARGKKKYFIVMQNVFYSTGRLSQRFDIKGCEVNRWVEPVSEGDAIVVLKDLNFEGKTIHLGPQRTWLLHQMELDTAFLRELNMMDYSLLLAFHHHQESERVHASRLIYSSRYMQGIQNLEELAAQKFCLLSEGPYTPNILDGPEQRYFLGLVDLATVYGLRKRLEYLWKMLWYSGRSFSTVNPTRYAHRLCQWVEAHSE